jgi:hypothetical protein
MQNNNSVHWFVTDKNLDTLTEQEYLEWLYCTGMK